MYTSEQFLAPPNIPKPHQRSRGLSPRRSTSFCTNTDSACRPITRTVLGQTDKSNSTSCSVGAGHRSRRGRISRIALEPGRIKADTMIAGFSSASTSRGAVKVAKTEELTVRVARVRCTHAVCATETVCTPVPAGTAMIVGGLQVLTTAITKSDAVSLADGSIRWGTRTG